MKPSPIILLTDFGHVDHYVGVMKGVILSINGSAEIIDLTHDILPMHITHGAMILEGAYSYFPAGAIFVCVVDPGVGTKRKAICVQSDRYFFLGPDNGLLSRALSHEKKYTTRVIENKKWFLKAAVSGTFHGRDIFAPVAAHLSKRNIFNGMGPVLKNMQLLDTPSLNLKTRLIQGEIIYFDHFGNAVTNISGTQLPAAEWDHAQIWINDISVGPLRKTYGEIRHLIAPLINSSGHLEIAMSRGSVKESLQLEMGDSVRVYLKTLTGREEQV